MRTLSPAVLAAVEARYQTPSDGNAPGLKLIKKADGKAYYTGETGGAPVTTGSASGLSLAKLNDTYYAAYTINSKLYLAHNSGSGWTAQLLASDANAGMCSVAVFDGEVYVAYLTRNADAAVIHNGSTVYPDGHSGNCYFGGRLAVIGGTLFLFYVNYNDRVMVYALSGGTWVYSAQFRQKTFTNVRVSASGSNVNIYAEYIESGESIVYLIEATASGTVLTQTGTNAAYIYGTSRASVYTDYTVPAVTVGGIVIEPEKTVQYARIDSWLQLRTKSGGAWSAWQVLVQNMEVASAPGMFLAASDRALNSFTYSGSAGEDLTRYLISATVQQQNDNPVAQCNLTLTPDAFDELEPGTALLLYLTFGASESLPMGAFYVDEVSVSAGSNTATASCRNSVGARLVSGTWGYQIDLAAMSANDAIEQVLNAAGVENAVVQPLPSTAYTWRFESGASFYDDIVKLIGSTATTLSVAELPDGTVVIGAEAWIAQNYAPVGTYSYGDGQLFTRQRRKSIDAAYSQLIVSSPNQGITPALEQVSNFDMWALPQRNFHTEAPAYITTQTAFDAYVADMLERMQYTGKTESFSGPIRPQLEVGDVAKHGNAVLGVVTRVSHTMGASGFKTDFSVDSGGTVMTVDGTLITKTAGANGYTRKQTMTDMMRVIAEGAK